MDRLRDWAAKRKAQKELTRSVYPPPGVDPRRPPIWLDLAKMAGVALGGMLGTMAVNGSLGQVLDQLGRKPKGEVIDEVARTRTKQLEESVAAAFGQADSARQIAGDAAKKAEAAEAEAARIRKLEEWARYRGYRPSKR